ncbi:hypothetical protein FDP41_012688 [Naegleria fowleri]|uniref:Uncharacterized protein n=1 Tax=Naegleria fowleri TaxID=5763 RepID=A0A6A5C4V5_NAEFO|nr:uncharacterized protein FDP41_012688 [Naegleria fowleri]KAF0980900.1 hypothetical protein FDP41_012688 [Naegleria fowleri]CAG4716601.1 unnamed protein product [Naegleria fowleri]
MEGIKKTDDFNAPKKMMGGGEDQNIAGNLANNLSASGGQYVDVGGRKESEKSNISQGKDQLRVGPRDQPIERTSNI